MPDDSKVIRLADRRKDDPAALAGLVPDEDLLTAARGCLQVAHRRAGDPEYQRQNRLALEVARLCLDRALELVDGADLQPDCTAAGEPLTADEREFLASMRGLGDDALRQAFMESLTRIKPGDGEDLAELTAWTKQRAAELRQDSR